MFVFESFVCRAMLRKCLMICYACLMAVTAQAAVSVSDQSLHLALATEPPNLNSLKSTDKVSAFILAHTLEGLMRYGDNQALVGGVAERWQETDLTVTFWLRKDARWHDGSPVTAHDFVAAWRAVLDPNNASPYAFIMYPIKHAKAVNEARLAPEKLGVRALDDYQLIVELEQPCPYFVGLTAFMSFYPIHRQLYQSAPSKYGSDPQFLPANGPFQLSQWVHGAKLELTKNPQYWDAESVRLQSIYIDHISSDPLANYNLFRNQNIAFTTINADNLLDAVERGIQLREFATGSLYYLRLNFNDGRKTQNLWLRKAIQAALNPDDLVNKVIAQAGMIPGRSLFPNYLTVGGQRLRERYPAPEVGQNIVAARRYFQRYQQETGKHPTRLVLLCGDSPTGVKQAVYIQQTLQLALGVDVYLDKQIFKQRLSKERAGDFDLVLTGWGPDYDDPMTFADLFASWNNNNRGGYISADYDAWIDQAQRSVDANERARLFNLMQQQLIADVALIPLYENVELYAQHPQLRGVRRSIFGGDPNLRDAYIVEERP